MTALYEVPVARGPLRARIRPPGSKSVTNRAVVCAAMAAGRTTLHGVLDCEDTRVMVAAWEQLGLSLEVQWAADVAHIAGCGGRLASRPPEPPIILPLANSGTSMRFLTAVLTALGGRYQLVGTARMHERPIGELVAALQQLSGGVTASHENQTPPVEIDSRGLIGGRAILQASESSQFVSAMLLAAPLARRPVTIEVAGPLVSRPYIAMTQRVMRDFGVDVRSDHHANQWSVEPQIYQPCDYRIEPDASAASYFFAAAAVAGGTVVVEGLSADSLQGDVAFVDFLEQMGCAVDRKPDSIAVTGPVRQGIDAHLADCSDTAQTLAVVALFTSGPTTLRGIAHNRFKETDRIGNLAIELRRLGARVDEGDDGLTVHPAPLRAACIETYGDHRMAMSFAIAGLRLPGTQIADPACVAKTYPRFFLDLEQVLQTATG